MGQEGEPDAAARRCEPHNQPHTGLFRRTSQMRTPPPHPTPVARFRPPSRQGDGAGGASGSGSGSGARGGTGSGGRLAVLLAAFGSA